RQEAGEECTKVDLTGFGLRASDFGPWTSDFGPWTSDLRLWTFVLGFWTSGLWNFLDFRSQILVLSKATDAGLVRRI
ncbi:MAG: hypothetical protein ACRD3W_23925, partial [Terriglobales bacterium]